MATLEWRMRLMGTISAQGHLLMRKATRANRGGAPGHMGGKGFGWDTVTEKHGG